VISIGLDVGKERDPAALTVLQSGQPRPGSHRPRWQALSIGNIELGTPYQRLADITAGVGLEFAQAGYPTVVTIDATGIGAAVVELVRTLAPELHVVAVTISSGHTLTHSAPDQYVVGKHRLTECLQVALEQRGLDIPDSDGARELRRQLERFTRRRTRTGYHRHEAAEGHDDLVLTLELAVWTGDTMYDQHAGVAL
jgi:hypothetical protein